MSYLDIIEWFKENKQPYDESKFKNIEDVKNIQKRILEFAESKDTLKSIVSGKWNNVALKQGIKDEIAKDMEKNNDKYSEAIKQEINVNMDYDRVAQITIDTSYKSDT